MKENNMMSYEMYEDFKETMVKTIKTELAAKTANNIRTSQCVYTFTLITRIHFRILIISIIVYDIINL